VVRVLGLALLLALGGVALARGSAVEEARTLLRDGDAAGAIAVCESALARGEDDLALRTVHARAALALGRVRVAHEELEKAAAEDELDAEATFDLARARLLYDDRQGVEQLLPSLERKTRTRVKAALEGAFAPLQQIRSEGGHYLVFSDVGVVGSDSAGAREAAKLLEASRRACLELLPVEDEKVVHRAFVFARQRTFARFTKLVDEQGAGESDGAFCEELRVLTVDASEGGGTFSEETRDVIFHESFHQLVSLYAPDLPSWLDEGLAEWFGATRVLPSGAIETGVVKKHAGNDTTRYEDMEHAIRDGTALSLGRFFQVKDEDFEREKDADRNYAEAWAVAHFLMADPTRRSVVLRYLELLHAGKKRDAAYGETFGALDLDALDGQFRRYFKGL